MLASKFLSKSKSEFYFVVISGFAVHLELDGSMALIEMTSLRDGIYNQDHVEADREISDFYNHILEEPVSNYTVRYIIEHSLKVMRDGNVKEVIDPPKMTKALADNLTKSNEVMTFCTDKNLVLEFVCFGTRPIVLETIKNKQQKEISVSPSLYYYATNYKGKIYSRPLSSSIVLFCNEDRTVGGVVLNIDMIKQTDYRQSQSQNITE